MLLAGTAVVFEEDLCNFKRAGVNVFVFIMFKLDCFEIDRALGVDMKKSPSFISSDLVKHWPLMTLTHSHEDLIGLFLPGGDLVLGPTEGCV